MKTKYIKYVFFFILLFGVFLGCVFKGYSASHMPFSHTHQAISPPCITINQVHLIGTEKLPTINAKRINIWREMIEGRCVNQTALLAYADDITAELAQAGYLTSYLSYPEQSLLQGVLKAEVILGTVSNIRYQGTENTQAKLSHIFPFDIKDVLNMRHIEQGLKNLQNTSLLSYQIELIRDPINQHATEVIVIGERQRARKGILSVEYWPVEGLPKVVMNHTFIFSNPLYISDLLYFDIHHSLGYSKGNKRQAIALGYSFPYRYWLFSINGNYQNSQTGIQINDTALAMQQRHRALLLNAQYILNRAENAVTSLGVSSQLQSADTFLAQQRLVTQKRLASYLTGELMYQRFFLQGYASISLKYKQGNDWFGSNAQQITGLERPQIYQLTFSSEWEKRPIYYQNSLDIQLSRSKLDGLLEQDAFIGKWGIEGFSNTNRAFGMGDNSLRLHNEVSWDTPWQSLRLYGSLGLGTTTNDRATFWRKNALFGSKVGARGKVGAVGFHAFVEAPIWQVNQFVANTIHSGLQVSVTY